MVWGPKTAFMGAKRATLGNQGHETAYQAAKRQSIGKSKVSRVISGYGGIMILLSWVRSSQKMGVNTKMLPFGCPVMKVTKNWTISEKNGFLAKNCIFCQKFCIFYATPMKPPFFSSEGPDSMRSYVPHILR